MKRNKDTAPGGPEKTKAELEKILETLKFQNYYERLGIGKDASKADVTKAFIGKSKEFHPDGKPAELKEFYDKIFQYLSEAKTVLSDKRKRSRYDLDLETKDPFEEDKRRRDQEARARAAAAEHAAREKAAREQQEQELGPKIAAAKNLAELLAILNAEGMIYTHGGSILGASIAIAIKSAGTSAMWGTPPSATELERELEARKVPAELGIRKKAVLLIFKKWEEENAAKARSANTGPKNAPPPGSNPNAGPATPPPQAPKEKPKTPEEENAEKILVEAREKYAAAYKEFLKKRSVWEKVGSFFAGSKTPEEKIPAELKALEFEYDNAATALGQTMFWAKQRELDLENPTRSGDDMNKELARYKQNEIFTRVIIEEQSRLTALKAENLPPKEKGVLKKSLDWYIQQPRWKKLVISTTVGTLFFAGFASGSVAAAGGIAAFVGIRAARGVAGMTAGHVAAKAYDWLFKDKSSAKRKAEEEELSKIFKEETFDASLAKSKKEYAEILERERKAKRDRLITKAMIGIAAGFGASYAVGASFHSGTGQVRPSGADENPSHTDNPELAKEFARREWADDKVMAHSTLDRPVPPVTPATTFVPNEGIKFEGGKGAIQGIKELKEQLSDQYGKDFSRAPEGVQKFMAEADPSKLAKNLGLYNPDNVDESALIQDGSALKFDEHGNLTFGKPGEMKILEKWEGPMRDYDHSGAAQTAESPASATDTAENASAAEPAAINAEQAQALKDMGYAGDPNDRQAVEEFFKTRAGTGTAENTPAEPAAASAAETQTPVTKPGEESWRSRPWDKSQGEAGYRTTKDFTAEELAAHDEAVRQARARVNYPPDNTPQGGGTPEATVGGYRAPEGYDQYPRPEARVSGYGFGHRDFGGFGNFGNAGEQYFGLGNTYRYDPQLGAYLRHFADVSPEDNDFINHHQEFAKHAYGFRGEQVLAAYDASKADLQLLFGSEHSVAWSKFDDMGARELARHADSGLNTDEDRIAKYLQIFSEHSGLEPKGGLLRFEESTKDYIARAMMKLSREGRIRDFQEEVRATLGK